MDMDSKFERTALKDTESDHTEVVDEADSVYWCGWHAYDLYGALWLISLLLVQLLRVSDFVIMVGNAALMVPLTRAVRTVVRRDTQPWYKWHDTQPWVYILVAMMGYNVLQSAYNMWMHGLFYHGYYPGKGTSG